MTWGVERLQWGWPLAIVATGCLSAAASFGLTPNVWQATAQVRSLEPTADVHAYLPHFTGPETADALYRMHETRELLGIEAQSPAAKQAFARALDQRVQVVSENAKVWLVVRDTDPDRAVALLGNILEASRETTLRRIQRHAESMVQGIEAELDLARTRFDSLATAPPATRQSVADRALWQARLTRAADRRAELEERLDAMHRQLHDPTVPWRVVSRSEEILQPLPRRIGPTLIVAFLLPVLLALVFWLLTRQ